MGVLITLYAGVEIQFQETVEMTKNRYLDVAREMGIWSEKFRIPESRSSLASPLSPTRGMRSSVAPPQAPLPPSPLPPMLIMEPTPGPSLSQISIFTDRLQDLVDYSYACAKDIMYHSNLIDMNIQKMVETIPQHKHFDKFLCLIRTTYESYTANYSRTFRAISARDNLAQLASQERNLTYLEGKLAFLMRELRIRMGRELINKTIDAYRTLNSLSEETAKKVAEYIVQHDRVCSEIFVGWTKQEDPMQHSWIKKVQISQDILSKIEPSLKSFVKKKINLCEKTKMKSEDLADFFHFYEMKYPIQSEFIAAAIRCSKEPASANRMDRLILVDVTIV